MRIIAHRGFWKTPEKKNSIESFIKAFDSGFGVETDIRDDRGNLVISHDMPSGSEIPLAVFFQLLKGRDLPIAINIKSDGLISPLKKLIDEYHIKNYFTFDMSFPESRRYVRYDLSPYISVSEFQPLNDLSDYAGIWLDSFEQDWFDSTTIQSLQTRLQKKGLCIVSPELHQRPHLPVWKMLKDTNLNQNENLAICTDFPDEADIFFNKEHL